MALVIKLLAHSPPLAMAEISRAVRLPYATSHRLVTTLVAEGLVRQEEGSKRYRLHYPA